MDELRTLRTLALKLGVHIRYTDGLGRRVVVAPETLVRVCAALGAPVTGLGDAAEALRAVRAGGRAAALSPVMVAWDGQLTPIKVPARAHAELRLEQGTSAGIRIAEGKLSATAVLPMGYHQLIVDAGGKVEECTVIAAPVEAWRRPGSHRSWGIGTHLAALRSSRSRSLGDLRDLEAVCRWVGNKGGDLVTVLPLLPTFNTEWPEPSPYSPVSRVFWSELILDLEAAHRPTAAPASLDVTRADAEVRAALARAPWPEPSQVDPELARYAQFRGAQKRMGRNWRDWPGEARAGQLSPDQIDREEERFHLVAQQLARQQLHDLRGRLEEDGLRLGLDLAVGVHPDGFDPWSRQQLFCEGMSVGAPPDGGFPSGQDWGFLPVLPTASRREGHKYIAASIAHQAFLAGVLRIDHIMAWTRLYWIPHGMGLHEGTYVSYPADELFAVLSLESHRGRCEVVGENLGTVPKDIFEALPRHRIWGMYLAMFAASDTRGISAPTSADMALVGTHDTPPFAGWLAGTDIADRVKYGLLQEAGVAAVQEERIAAIQRLAERLSCRPEERLSFLATLLDWLGRSASPLVVPWFEDFWLEETAVNLPGTPSSLRPNWQRPMQPLLDHIFTDPQVDQLIRLLDHARTASGAVSSSSSS
jgi:4-alpha-glucanotransferase